MASFGKSPGGRGNLMAVFPGCHPVLIRLRAVGADERNGWRDLRSAGTCRERAKKSRGRLFLHPTQVGAEYPGCSAAIG